MEVKLVKTENDLLKKDVKKHESQIEQLEKQNDKLKINSTHNSEMVGVQNELKKKIAKIDKMKKKIGEFKKQKQDIQDECEQLRQERDNACFELH